MTDSYNDGKWYGWNGGKCPLHPETLIDYVWLYKGDKRSVAVTDKQAGAILFEGHDHGELVAFRVVKEYKEPREWWIFTNGHGDTCVSTTWRKDAVHVREVLD